MTLGRKMAYQTAAMIIGLLMISAASLWGINRLYADYAGVAIEAYAQLREVYDIRADVRAAEELLTTTPPQRELAGRAVKNAIAKLGAATQSEMAHGPGGGSAGAGSVGAESVQGGAPEGAGAPVADAAVARADVLGSGASAYQVQQGTVRQRLQAAYAQLRDPAVRPSYGGRADDTEALELVRVPFREALDAAVDGHLTDILTVAMLLKASHMAREGLLATALARAMLG